MSQRPQTVPGGRDGTVGAAETPGAHARLMDGMYRYQRFIYDATRKFYLLGRDRLIRELPVKPGDRVLEVGCGTGRNLLLAARRHPQVSFYGLDISEEMLRTARAKLDRAGLQIPLVAASAEDLDAERMFGVAEGFDTIFFSYSLSMIPPWREALHAGFEAVRPGGHVAMVDFWDQGAWPGWFRAMLKGWLTLFHVRHEPALLDHLQDLERQGAFRLKIDAVAGRYAVLALMRDVKAGSRVSRG